LRQNGFKIFEIINPLAIFSPDRTPAVFMVYQKKKQIEKNKTREEEEEEEEKGWVMLNG